jgi:hypothetical protein
MARDSGTIGAGSSRFARGAWTNMRIGADQGPTDTHLLQTQFVSWGHNM